MKPDAGPSSSRETMSQRQQRLSAPQIAQDEAFARDFVQAEGGLAYPSSPQQEPPKPSRDPYDSDNSEWFRSASEDEEEREAKRKMSTKGNLKKIRRLAREKEEAAKGKGKEKRVDRGQLSRPPVNMAAGVDIVREEADPSRRDHIWEINHYIADGRPLLHRMDGFRVVYGRYVDLRREFPPNQPTSHMVNPLTGMRWTANELEAYPRGYPGYPSHGVVGRPLTETALAEVRPPGEVPRGTRNRSPQHRLQCPVPVTHFDRSNEGLSFLGRPGDWRAPRIVGELDRLRHVAEQPCNFAANDFFGKLKEEANRLIPRERSTVQQRLAEMSFRRPGWAPFKPTGQHKKRTLDLAVAIDLEACIAQVRKDLAESDDPDALAAFNAAIAAESGGAGIPNVVEMDTAPGPLLP